MKESCLEEEGGRMESLKEETYVLRFFLRANKTSGGR